MDWLLISHENKVGCFRVHLVFSGCSQILAEIIASIPLDLPACKFYNFLVLIKSKLYCKYKRLWVKSSNANMLIHCFILLYFFFYPGCWRWGMHHRQWGPFSHPPYKWILSKYSLKGTSATQLPSTKNVSFSVSLPTPWSWRSYLQWRHKEYIFHCNLCRFPPFHIDDLIIFISSLLIMKCQICVVVVGWDQNGCY